MPARMNPPLALIIATAGAAGLARSAQAQWAPPYWEVERIGLFGGPEFTRDDGLQLTQYHIGAGMGRIIGSSQRFSGAAESGRAAWAWAPGEGTTRLGFVDGPLFTSSEGAQHSDHSWHNSAGRITGSSRMYSGAMNRGQAAWTWDAVGGLVATGLVGPEFISTGGFRTDVNDQINEAGRLTGRSFRFTGGMFPNGQASWTWDAAGGTVRTGLYTGPEFTASDGTQISNNTRLNDAGRIAGTSARYGGSESTGTATWTWDAAGGTVRTGLFEGAEFTRSDGYQFSRIVEMNAAGRITGTSSRANGGPALLGQAAWTWDAAGGTVRIGLFQGPEFTASNGSQWSQPNSLTTAGPGLSEAGRVIGTSERFDGAGLPRGTASWTWDADGGTVRTGLTSGLEFNSINGTRQSGNLAVNEAGRISGFSTRYTGAAPINRATWTWDTATGTVRTGLVGPEFTATDASQNSGHSALNLAGRITGWSERFSGNDSAGRATWTWDAATGTVRTGLHNGAEFTRGDGSQFSDNLSLRESSRIVGTSERFSNGVAAGTATWTWTPADGTVRTGLYDAVHTSGDGAITNAVAFGRESGYIVGTALRSGGGEAGSLGQSGWFYDPATLLTTELVFSSAADGRAATAPTVLTEGGVVLGMYDLFSGDSLISTNAFIWSLTNGFADLDSVVDGGLSAEGIARLTSILGVNDSGRILAHGLPLGLPPGSQGLYALTIPAPGGATALGAVGLLALARRRRR